MATVIIAVLGSGVLSAVISGLFSLARDKQAYKHQDNTQESQDMAALKKAVRLLLCERIRYIAIDCIANNEVDPDVLRMLNEMHDSYHGGLDGNGDLDKLMGRVNGLPLKQSE